MTPQGHQIGGTTHEKRDADAIGLTLVAALLLLLVSISFLAVWGVIHYLQRKEEPVRRGSAVAFPEPRLEVMPGDALAKNRARAAAELDSYGWIDRPRGVAHIPISQATQLLLQRGLPEVGGGQTRLQLLQARPQTNLQPNEPITAPSPEVSP